MGRGDGEGLPLDLEVDQGEGFKPRQSATTTAMILDARELLERIAEQVSKAGRRTRMPVWRGDETRYYPFAVPDQKQGSLRLPAGSVVLKSVPPHTTAVGVPARIHKTPPRHDQPALEMDHRIPNDGEPLQEKAQS